MPMNHLTLSSPYLFAFYFSPASGSFPLSWVFTLGGQGIGASASALVLPVNIQDWFLLGLTGLISLQSKGFSRVFSNTTIRKHQFFGSQPSLWFNFHKHTWLLEKSWLWLDGPFSAKSCLCFFNTLSRFVMAFLPRSKCLLISWLQNNNNNNDNFMAAVTIRRGFVAQENKVCHCFHCLSIYLPWSDGTGCHDLCFLNGEF